MELSDVLRRLKLAGIGFLAVLAVGVLGYGYISNGEWLDAFYMTAITIATIGFREVIDLSGSPFGKVFTVFLSFSGIGIFTYFLTNVAALFIEDDLRKKFYTTKRMKKIEKMNDHYIVCGCGRVGRNIAKELYDTDRPFVLSDIDEKVLDQFLPEVPDTLFAAGDATKDEFLESMGIKKAAGIFATAKDDNTNLVICLTARQLNPDIRIVTRLNDVAHESKMRHAGADRIVSPNYIGGLRMASEMVRPTVSSFIENMVSMSDSESGHNLRMEEIYITEKFSGKTIEHIPIEGCESTLVLALKTEGEWIYNPKKEKEINAGNVVVLMTTPKEHKLIEDRMS